jgi:hypothetical protein
VLLLTFGLRKHAYVPLITFLPVNTEELKLKTDSMFAGHWNNSQCLIVIQLMNRKDNYMQVDFNWNTIFVKVALRQFDIHVYIYFIFLSDSWIKKPLFNCFGLKSLSGSNVI